jgi:hypothetical protein
MGTIAFSALLFIYLKLPLRIQDWFDSHPLTSELTSIAFFFTTITSVTSSIVGIFASFWAGLLWTIFMFFRKKKPG